MPKIKQPKLKKVAVVTEQKMLIQNQRENTEKAERRRMTESERHGVIEKRRRERGWVDRVQRDTQILSLVLEAVIKLSTLVNDGNC